MPSRSVSGGSPIARRFNGVGYIRPRFSPLPLKRSPMMDASDEVASEGLDTPTLQRYFKFNRSKRFFESGGAYSVDFTASNNSTPMESPKSRRHSSNDRLNVENGHKRSVPSAISPSKAAALSRLKSGPNTLPRSRPFSKLTIGDSPDILQCSAVVPKVDMKPDDVDDVAVVFTNSTVVIDENGNRAIPPPTVALPPNCDGALIPVQQSSSNDNNNSQFASIISVELDQPHAQLKLPSSPSSTERDTYAEFDEKLGSPDSGASFRSFSLDNSGSGHAFSSRASSSRSSSSRSNWLLREKGPELRGTEINTDSLTSLKHLKNQHSTASTLARHTWSRFYSGNSLSERYLTRGHLRLVKSQTSGSLRQTSLNLKRPAETLVQDKSALFDRNSKTLRQSNSLEDLRYLRQTSLRKSQVSSRKASRKSVFGVFDTDNSDSFKQTNSEKAPVCCCCDSMTSSQSIALNLYNTMKANAALTGKSMFYLPNSKQCPEKPAEFEMTFISDGVLTLKTADENGKSIEVEERPKKSSLKKCDGEVPIAKKISDLQEQAPRIKVTTASLNSHGSYSDMSGVDSASIGSGYSKQRTSSGTVFSDVHFLGNIRFSDAGSAQSIPLATSVVGSQLSPSGSSTSDLSTFSKYDSQHRSCPDLLEPCLTQELVKSLQDEEDGELTHSFLKKKNQLRQRHLKKPSWSEKGMEKWTLDDILMWLQYCRLDQVASIVVGYDLTGADVAKWDQESIANLPMDRVVQDKLLKELKRAKLPRKTSNRSRKHSMVQHAGLYNFLIAQQDCLLRLIPVQLPNDFQSHQLIVAENSHGALVVTKVRNDDVDLTVGDCVIEVNAQSCMHMPAVDFNKRLSATSGPHKLVIIRQIKPVINNNNESFNCYNSKSVDSFHNISIDSNVSVINAISSNINDDFNVMHF